MSLRFAAPLLAALLILLPIGGHARGHKDTGVQFTIDGAAKDKDLIARTLMKIPPVFLGHGPYTIYHITEPKRWTDGYYCDGVTYPRLHEVHIKANDVSPARFQSVVLHEAGHCIYTLLDKDTEKRWKALWKKDCHLDHLITGYAGSDCYEGFSESFQAWILLPDSVYAARCPEDKQFFEDLSARLQAEIPTTP